MITIPIWLLAILCILPIACTLASIWLTSSRPIEVSVQAPSYFRNQGKEEAMFDDSVLTEDELEDLYNG